MLVLWLSLAPILSKYQTQKRKANEVGGKSYSVLLHDCQSDIIIFFLHKAMSVRLLPKILVISSPLLNFCTPHIIYHNNLVILQYVFIIT